MLTFCHRTTLCPHNLLSCTSYSVSLEDGRQLELILLPSLLGNISFGAVVMIATLLKHLLIADEMRRDHFSSTLTRCYAGVILLYLPCQCWWWLLNTCLWTPSSARKDLLCGPLLKQHQHWTNEGHSHCPCARP